MVKSAARVLTLLELFDAECRPLRVTEIAELLGAPQSSVSMLLKTLVAGGYMDHDAEKRTFSPSARIAFLGSWVIHSPNNDVEVPDIMRRLARETGETVLLGRLTGVHLQYLSIIDSDQTLRFSPTPGTLRPLHRSAIGIMLLSEMSDAQIGLLIRRFNAQRPETQSAIRPTELMRAIAFARDHGYYETAGVMTPGAGVIATVLPLAMRGVRIGIGIGAPFARLHAKRKLLIATLLRIAKEESTGIG